MIEAVFAVVGALAGGAVIWFLRIAEVAAETRGVLDEADRKQLRALVNCLSQVFDRNPWSSALDDLGVNTLGVKMHPRIDVRGVLGSRARDSSVEWYRGS